MSELHNKTVRLARQAFAAGLANRWPSAATYVARINDECGGEGLTLALVAWCDTYIDHATDGRMNPASPARVNFINYDTGGLDGVGSPDVPARIQWAGRLVQARAAMDEPRWQALLEELPADETEIGSYVLAVLEVTAVTVNGLPRGFTRMGKASTA